jgi:hypothetical protein
MDAEDESDMVLEMSQTDLRSQIHDAVDEALNALEERAFKPVLDQLAALAGDASATKEQNTTLIQAFKEMGTTIAAAITSEHKAVKEAVTKLEERLKELEGSTPAAAQRRPSQSDANRANKEQLPADLKQEGAIIDPYQLAAQGVTARMAAAS